MRKAEKLCIDHLLARIDNRIFRTLLVDWNQVGTIQWISQTSKEPDRTNRGAKKP